ncbi:MAG: BlaI/MecI/CopY family transcriptional regulator [Acidobacteriota bacterium]
MPRKPNLRPTDSELAILRVLWQRGPSTVRQVQAELEQQEPTGYTTVLKLLQIMTDKGLVERDEAQRAHVYRTRDSEEATQRHLIGDLLDRAFDGSAAKLVMQALSTRPASTHEMAKIRQLLDRMDGDDPSPADDRSTGDER